MVTKDNEGPGWFSGQTVELEGRRCLNGAGPVPADIVFVDKAPDQKEVWTGRPYTSKAAQFLMRKLKEARFPVNKARFTYATHHAPKKYTAAEVNWGKRMFAEEMASVNPKLVVTFGAEPLKQVVGTSYRWDDVHGAWIRPDTIQDCRFEVFPTFNLEQVLFNQKWDVYFEADLRRITNRLFNTPELPPHCDNAVIHAPNEIRSFADWILSKDRTVMTLDCEWNGKNWMDTGRYFRTVQLGYAKGKVVTIEVSTEGGKRCYDGDERDIFSELKRLLESPKVGIVGHNVIADGEWLLSYGVDIRPRVVYDTMLAEHIIDQNGPFGLEALAMKYTPYGRYSTDVEVWVRRHQNAKLPDTSANGYGFVPRDMLMSYGYADVDVLWYILDEQIPVLRRRGCFRRRGVNGEYPSLLQTVLDTQRVTYDLEINGLPVDMAQLDMLTERYQAARSETLSKVMQLARSAGFEDFNPRSVQHLRKMLFGVLKLTPVKTTDGNDWGEVAGEMGMDDETDVAAATDKSTLQILEGQHPFVDALLDFRRIDQTCKTWLTKEKDGEPAGLYKDLWPDGTLKSRFLTLTETGRYRTSSPNCFPGEVEVLTELGWIPWNELYYRSDRDDVKLAQWDVDTLEITFARPNAYVKHDDAKCVHVYGRQQLDIMCTPDHRFTVYHRKDKSRKEQIVASQLQKYVDYIVPQAGKLVKEGEHLDESQVAVICALQADGYLVPGGGIDWRFDKKRKYDRLCRALWSAGISYRPYTSNSKGRTRHCVYVGKHDVPVWLLGKKEFGPWLFRYDSDTLAMFEKEVWEWDGCSTRKSMFASANPVNAGFVQALCLFNGRRGKIRRYVSNTGSVSWQVDAANHGYTQLANLESVEMASRRTVYCVNMPKDTVIVRYNGKVAFTNQSQNWPKKAESYLSKIFGEGNEPPMLRTIVDPNQRAEYRGLGKKIVQIEGDFCQAELFCMANITGDENMIKTLTTPGLDLHDKTTVGSFGFHVYDDAGREVSEDDLVRMAADLKDQGGAESDEYQHFMKTLVYVDAHGNKMTRAQFKSGPRVSGKAISFGVPYGRGASALALQIKAETGDTRTLDEITAEASKMLNAWKTELFPTCWAELTRWRELVYTQGWIENPWGMRKTAHIRPGERDPALERQFGNYPIQSTVAGTVQIAMGQMKKYIVDRGLPFKIQNQIHDAVMIECPLDMADECKRMFKETMAGIHIPLPGGRWFSLDIDLDVYERWGVKMK